jgi:hypothetical protein
LNIQKWIISYKFFFIFSVLQLINFHVSFNFTYPYEEVLAVGDEVKLAAKFAAAAERALNMLNLAFVLLNASESGMPSPGC